MRHSRLLLLVWVVGCSLGYDKEGVPPNTETDTDTDTDSDTDTDTDTDTDSDTDTDAEPDSIAEGRTGVTVCTSGGAVSNAQMSGSFCFAPVDIVSGTTATSASFQWQPGPVTPVSP